MLESNPLKSIMLVLVRRLAVSGRRPSSPPGHLRAEEIAAAVLHPVGQGLHMYLSLSLYIYIYTFIITTTTTTTNDNNINNDIIMIIIIVCMCVYTYMYIYIYIYLYLSLSIYIYIYRELVIISPTMNSKTPFIFKNDTLSFTPLAISFVTSQGFFFLKL